MDKITLSDFSGGIQEAFSPDDFTGRQWSILRGIVPRDETTFESQWPAQRIGGVPAPTETFNQVFPLESSVGTFLVAIKRDGSIWWCKVPPASGEDASYTNANGVSWFNIQYAENKGVNRGAGGGYSPVPGLIAPPIPVANIPAYRFITGIPFEVYKYVKSPFPGREMDVYQDRVFDSLIDTNADGTYTPVDENEKDARSVCPGVLIGFRRSYRKVNNATVFGVFDEAGAIIAPADQAMLVAYVDPKEVSDPAVNPDWNGAAIVGAVKIVSFPHFRRWPAQTETLVNNQLTDPIVGYWDAATVNGVDYARSPMRPGATPVSAPPSLEQGSSLVVSKATFQYPFPKNPDGTYVPSGNPGPINMFHPYTYLTGVNALLPGTGLIPRGTVGTMWNNQLLIGDIEWRADGTFTAAETINKATVPPNSALVGPPALTDGNTEPHRGSFYYSEADIDEFDPRSVIRASSSDARIAGMHMLDNRLICITTAGGPNDGVVAFSGNLGQLHPYDESISANPFAIRKQLIRGGVGVADHPDTGEAYGSQTCLWSEMGVAVFIDRLGGVFYTDGATCDRLDRFGPKQPKGSTHYDHVAAAGKHLLVWRDGRLLVMTVMESSGNAANGCWTELLTPTTSPYGVRSMVGSTNQVFMVVDGAVWRYLLDGPAEEKGCINGVERELTIATPTLGLPEQHKKTNWHRVGVSFYTETSCTLSYVTTKAAPSLAEATPAPSPDPAPVPSYTTEPAAAYTNGHYSYVCPAGVGPQEVISITYVFKGNVIIQSATVWGTGGFMQRGDD